VGSRRVVTGITLLVLCGILAVGAWVGWRQLVSPVSEDDPQTSACSRTEVRRGQRLASRAVTVSVFNAGSRVGLADQTRNGLVRRGFRDGGVGNTPSGTDVRRVQVWTTQRQDLAASLVARQFRGKVPIRVVDENLGPGVVVVVGNLFDGLRPKAPRSLRATKSQSTCVER
jgi:hypothetical protein